MNSPTHPDAGDEVAVERQMASIIVSYIAASGRTRKSVQEAVDMSKDSFGRALNGRRGFAFRELMRFADVLNIPMDVLLAPAIKDRADAA